MAVLGSSQGSTQTLHPSQGSVLTFLEEGAGIPAQSSSSGCSHSPLDDAVVELEIAGDRPHLLQQLLHPAGTETALTPASCRDTASP